jgi:glutaredoxin 3
MALELFGARSCQFTAELREDLEWRGLAFIEYDVEADPNALQRMLSLTDGERTVPVLVEDGVVKQIGWQGRGCVVGLHSEQKA